MRLTEKHWCAVCKFLTYGCRHEPEPRPELPAPFRPMVIRARQPELMVLPIGTRSSMGPGGEVAGGAFCVIAAEPQIAFRPLRFHVAPEIAASFDLLDLRFGTLSKFAAYGAVPASVFTPPAGINLDELERVPFDNIAGIGVVMPGMVIALNVLNRSRDPLHFCAMMAGHGLDTTAHLR